MSVNYDCLGIRVLISASEIEELFIMALLLIFVISR